MGDAVLQEFLRADLETLRAIEPDGIDLGFQVEFPGAHPGDGVANAFVENLPPEGGILFCDSTLVNKKSERDDIKAVYVPATGLANDHDLMGFANVIMLGAIVKSTGIFGIDIPDMIMRVVGVIDLIAVAALAFTTVIKLKNRDK